MREENIHLLAPELASLFGFFQNNKQTVIWLRDSNDKQLYVGPQFEDIWKRDSRFLYEEPNYWYETLLPEDREDFTQKYTIRQTHRNKNIKEILFRIHVPGENIKFIRDFCIKLYNQQGQIKGYAGICQSISLDEWQHHKDAQLSELKQPQHLPTNSSLPFHNLLSSIIAPVKNSSISNTKEDSSRLYFIHTPTGKINLAKREAECLYHLCHGRSAKETGSLLFLSQRTVETYIESLKKKTESRTKIEILRKIDISGFVDHFEKIQLEPTLSH